MSLFRKKSKDTSITKSPKHPRSSPSSSSPFQDPTPSSPSVPTMSTSASSRSPPTTLRPSDSTSSSTSSLIPRPRKSSLKGLFSSGSVRKVSQSVGKASKDMLGGGGEPTPDEAGAGGGGGLGGWMSRRRSKDVLGYEGAGFAGAVDHDPAGSPRPRMASGSSSGGGRGGSLGRAAATQEVREEHEGLEEEITSGDRPRDMREPIATTTYQTIPTASDHASNLERSPPTHPFTPMFSSKPHSPALGAAVGGLSGSPSSSARRSPSLASPNIPQTPPQLPSRIPQPTSSSSRSSSPSGKASTQSESDRMRRASLLSLFSGSTKSKQAAKPRGSGTEPETSSSGRASVEVDKEPMSSSSVVLSSQAEDSSGLASEGGPGRGSRSSSPSPGPGRLWTHEINKLHTGNSSPSSLAAALPTPSPYGHPSFMPTSPTFQPTSGSQPLPPVISTSISTGPSTADLPATSSPASAHGNRPDLTTPTFGSRPLPATPTSGSASPSQASASEALLQTLVLQSATAPRVKLKKKNSLGSSSPAGRVRKKKVEGESPDSRGSSRRGSMDIKRPDVAESPVVVAAAEGLTAAAISGEEGPPTSVRAKEESAVADEVSAPSEAITALEPEELAPPPPAPATAAAVEEPTQDEAESSILTKGFERAATGGEEIPISVPTPPSSAPPDAPSVESSTVALPEAEAAHESTQKNTHHHVPSAADAPDPDDSLHPAPLTFFDVQPKPAQLQLAAPAKSTRTRTRTRSSGPFPQTTATPSANTSYLTFRLPNPFHPFLPLLSIPLSLAPEKVGQLVRQDKVVLDLRGVLGVEQLVGAVGTVGTVVKWGVGWWVIIPYRAVNGVVGVLRGGK